MAGRSGPDGADRVTGYCTDCGEGLPSTANYCPNCGTSRDAATSRRTRRVDGNGDGHASAGRAALENRAARALESGWEIDRDFGDHVVLVRRDLGGVGMHLLVALVTIWWTMGIGNGLYALYRYVARAERTVIREDDAAPAVRGAEAASSDWSPLAVAFRWFAGALLIALGTSISTTALAAATIGFGAAVALAGVGHLPPVRRRLEVRRSFTTNGRHRRVDERSIAGATEPCTCCAGPVARGVERTYRDAYYVLGVPLSTNVEGHNVYCRACANGDLTRRDDEDDDRRNQRDDAGRRTHDDVSEGNRRPKSESERPI